MPFDSKQYDVSTRGYDANTSNLVAERAVEMANIPGSPVISARSAGSEVAQLRQPGEESPALVSCHSTLTQKTCVRDPRLNNLIKPMGLSKVSAQG